MKAEITAIMRTLGYETDSYGDLYWNWLDTDYSYMDMLRDSVDEYIGAVISEQKAEKAAPTPEKEPQKPTPQKPKQPYTLLGDLRET